MCSPKAVQLLIVCVCVFVDAWLDAWLCCLLCIQVLLDFAKKCPLGAVHMLPALTAAVPACTLAYRLLQVVLLFDGIAHANAVWPHVPASTASDMFSALESIVERIGLPDGKARYRTMRELLHGFSFVCSCEVWFVVEVLERSFRVFSPDSGLPVFLRAFETC